MLLREKKWGLWDEITTLTRNITAVLLEMKKYDECIEECNKVLSKRPNDAIVIYRRAKCFRFKNYVEKANEEILKALQLEPNHELIKLEYQKIQNALRKEEESLKKKLRGFLLKTKEELYEDAKPYDEEEEWRLKSEEDKRLGRKVWFSSAGFECYEQL